MLINLDSLLKLLDVSDGNGDLLSLRQSNRAKRLIFKPSIRNGFEIVLPRYYDDKWVLEAVTKSKSKIKKRLAEIKEARTELKPTSIALPVTGNSWKVIYVGGSDKDSSTVTEASDTLEVPEKAWDVFGAPIVLQKWLHDKALAYLPGRLSDVATKLKLSYNKVRIKRQKTLWGSCSIKRNINLNRNLMLMPYEVVDYVLHHELTHLRILNHAPKFWKELESSLPGYKKRLKELKHFEKNNMPEWALV